MILSVLLLMMFGFFQGACFDFIHTEQYMHSVNNSLVISLLSYLWLILFFISFSYWLWCELVFGCYSKKQYFYWGVLKQHKSIFHCKHQLRWPSLIWKVSVILVNSEKNYPTFQFPSTVWRFLTTFSSLFLYLVYAYAHRNMKIILV